MFNYNHLLYFKTVAEEGNLVRAAKKLSLTQSTISIQLKQLEQSLGKDLFERRKQRLYLTDTGKLVLEYSRAIFALGDEMAGSLRNKPSPREVKIQIGIHETVGKSFVQKVLSTALSHDECRLSAVVGELDRLLERLEAHQLDLVIANSPPAMRFEKTLFGRKIAQVRAHVFGPANIVLPETTFPSSLDGRNFIMPRSGSKFRQDLEHFFQLSKIKPRIIAELDDTFLQKSLAAQHDAFVVLPRAVGQDFVQRKALRDFGAIDVTKEIWIISGRRKIENPVAAAILRGLDI